MTRQRNIWFLAIVAAMGGFLFGYDTAVINGAEREIQTFFNLSPALHGLVMSSALWGTVLGALSGGRISDRHGRRPTLICIGALYSVSAIWSAMAADPVSLMIARFIGGLGVGCSSVVAPVYIAEISPTEKRGLMTAIFQLDVVTGMCASQFVNMSIAKTGDGAWRWMLGAEAVPAILFFVLCFFIIESPRWLAASRTAAGQMASGSKYSALKDTGDGTDERRGAFWTRANRRPIFLAIALAVFNQLSGVNAVLYYMPRIYQMAGFTTDTSMMLSAMANVFFMIGTVIGMVLIDRIGRKSLLITGGAGYVFSLFALATAFHFGQGTAAAVCLVLFLLSHAIGQGTVVWVLMAEIFPTAVRGQGQSVGSFTHWTMSAIITMTFPIAVAKTIPEVIFGVFGAFMVLHLLWAIFIVPETKGKSLEQLSGEQT